MRLLCVVWKTKELASRTLIHNRCLFKRKRSVFSIKEKIEDTDDIVFQMICKSVVSRFNVQQRKFTLLPCALNSVFILRDALT